MRTMIVVRGEAFLVLPPRLGRCRDHGHGHGMLLLIILAAAATTTARAWVTERGAPRIRPKRPRPIRPQPSLLLHPPHHHSRRCRPFQLTVINRHGTSLDAAAGRGILPTALTRAGGRSLPCGSAASASAAAPASDLGDADGYSEDEEDRDGDGDANNNDDYDDFDDQLIDSFLRGDYDYEISDDAPSPRPGLAPASLVRECLRSLRSLDDPTPSHGAAVLQRFLLPLSRKERWGDFAAAAAASTATAATAPPTSSTDSLDDDPWRTQIMRGALTPHLLARQIRSSGDFGCLLDWTDLEVTDGGSDIGGGSGSSGSGPDRRDGAPLPSVAHVDATLRLDDDGSSSSRAEPVRIRFTLRRIGGVWLIDTAARRSSFAETETEPPPFD